MSSSGAGTAGAAKDATTRIVNEGNTSTPIGCSILATTAAGTAAHHAGGGGAGLKYEFVFNSATASSARCGEQATLRIGSATSFVNTTIELTLAAGAGAGAGAGAAMRTGSGVRPTGNGQTATITMAGPAASWFGVGFGGVGMKGTYAIIVSGNGDVVSESAS